MTDDDMTGDSWDEDEEERVATAEGLRFIDKIHKEKNKTYLEPGSMQARILSFKVPPL